MHVSDILQYLPFPAPCMRTILHVSDLHFGKADPRLIALFVAECARICPDMLIVSGDLTQRGTLEEFEMTRVFLDTLRGTGIRHFVIPGNHDIRPLYHPIARALTPFDRYKDAVGHDIEPRYIDDEIAIAAIDTVCRGRILNGAVNKKQIERTNAWFAQLHTNAVRIVVSHHPFDLPPGRSTRPPTIGAERVIRELDSSRIDLYLAGHHHISSVLSTGDRYQGLSAPSIAVQAGTVSMREYGETQSFNLLTIHRDEIRVDIYHFDVSKTHFHIVSSHRCVRSERGWQVAEVATNGRPLPIQEMTPFAFASRITWEILERL